MTPETIEPRIARAIADFLVAEGMATASAGAVVQALSDDLSEGLPSAARIYDGLLLRIIEKSRDSTVALVYEVVDISALTSALGEA